LPALGLILAVGLALRVVALGRVPPGMWSDEALNGIDAWNVWHGGGFRLVYPDVFPREPLFETLLAFVVRFAGPSILALRAVPVAIGTLTILLLYLALRRETGETVALTAAGVLAGMRWHALFSRLIFRTIVLPPWMILLVWAALAYRRRPSSARAALVGALIGGGFYTYLAWYFMLPFVAGLVLWLVWPTARGRGENGNAECGVRSAESGGGGMSRLAMMLIVAALVFAPLGRHYWRHPDHLLARPGAVSVFAQGLGPGLREIAKNAGEALLMFHWRGDHVPVQNLPHAPALDPLQGLFFLWGLALCLVGVRRRQPLPGILLGWIACGLAATVFTHTDSPNFLRTLVIAPAAATIVALGLVDAGRRLARRAGPVVATICVVAVLLASAGWTGWQLRQWSRLPEVWGKYQTDVVRMGAQARGAAGPDTAVFIPAPFKESLPLRFQILGVGNVHFYDDWSFLASWPPTPSAAGSPRPARRLVYCMTGTGLADAILRLVPQARPVSTMPGPPGVRAIDGAILAPEEALPSAETVRRLNDRLQAPSAASRR
jgi:4-amino-4-deoxy-L-arabinose transferase-like glycosyltransferase